jgi:DNA ligase-associated metallophosphoesterase
MPAISVFFSGQHFLLLPEKAMFHPENRCLFIADIHLGKIAHFRKSGIAVPQKASFDNFKRMTHLIQELNPVCVIFLGDIFHSKKNSDWIRFNQFRKSFSKTEFHLVRGNHDTSESNEVLEGYFNAVHPDELLWNDFLLTHEPSFDTARYNICGHIHPSVRISGRGRQSLRLPCFYQVSNGIVLPAFGTFTGNHTILLKKTDCAYAIIKDQILRIEK